MSPSRADAVDGAQTFVGITSMLLRALLPALLMLLATPARSESGDPLFGLWIGAPTSYLQGVKEVVWDLTLEGNCARLTVDNLTSAARFTLNASGLRFVNGRELLETLNTPTTQNRFKQPNLILSVRALRVGAACTADISAHVTVAIEGGYVIFSRKPLQQGAMMNIWHDAGEIISGPSDQIEGQTSQALDRLIKRFANAWVASQPR